VIDVDSLDDLVDTQRIASLAAQATTDIAIVPIDLPPAPSAASAPGAASTARHRRKTISCRLRARRHGRVDTTLIGVAIASMVILFLIVLILS
jgi:hypothetical protein